jgi:hypothetical protein
VQKSLVDALEKHLPTGGQVRLLRILNHLLSNACGYNIYVVTLYCLTLSLVLMSFDYHSE